MANSPIVLLGRTYQFLILRMLVTLVAIYPAYAMFRWGSKLGIALTGVNMPLSNLLFGYCGLAFSLYFITLARKYLVHLVRYAQLACVVELIEGREIKGSYLVYGFKKLGERFGSVSIMFAVDLALTKAVGKITRMIVEKGEFLPEFLKTGIISRMVNSTIKTLVFHVDEVVIAHMYRNPELDLWDGCCEGIALYVQSWKGALKTAFMNVLYTKLLVWTINAIVLAFCIVLVRFGDFQSFVVFLISYWIVSALIRSSLVEPYQSIHVLMGFLTASKGKEPSVDVMAKLDEISPDFRGMFRKTKRGESSLADKLGEVIGGAVDTGQVGELSDLAAKTVKVLTNTGKATAKIDQPGN